MKLNKIAMTALGAFVLVSAFSEGTLKAAREKEEDTKGKAQTDPVFSRKVDHKGMIDHTLFEKAGTSWIKAEKKKEKVEFTGTDVSKLPGWVTTVSIGKAPRLEILFSSTGSLSAAERASLGKYGRFEGNKFYVGEGNVKAILNDKKILPKLNEHGSIFNLTYNEEVVGESIKRFSGLGRLSEDVTSVLRIHDKIITTEGGKETAYDAKMGKKLWDYDSEGKIFTAYDFGFLRAYWVAESMDQAGNDALNSSINFRFKNNAIVANKLRQWAVSYSPDEDGPLRAKGFPYAIWRAPENKVFFKENMVSLKVHFQGDQDVENWRRFILREFESPVGGDLPVAAISEQK